LLNKVVKSEEGIMAAEAKGRKKALIENAKNLLLETDLPVEKIAKCCSLPVEQVNSLKDELTKETEKD
jgi:predicted transposase YdaD